MKKVVMALVLIAILVVAVLGITVLRQTKIPKAEPTIRPTPTSSSSPASATATPRFSITPTPTASPTPKPTATPTITPTSTPTPTPTPAYRPPALRSNNPGAQWHIVPIWFYPSDRDLVPAWQTKMNTLMADSRNFYSQNLQGKTFDHVAPIAIRGSHEEAWYYSITACTSDTNPDIRAYYNALCDIEEIRPDIKMQQDKKYYTILTAQSQWSGTPPCLGVGGDTGGIAFCNWYDGGNNKNYTNGVNPGVIHELGHSMNYLGRYIDHGKPDDSCASLPDDYLVYRGFSKTEITAIKSSQEACIMHSTMGAGVANYPKGYFIPRHREYLLLHPAIQ